jgi:hypothetical protein
MIYSTAVIDHLERTSTCPVVYFYFDFKDSVKQATESMVRSIALQIETSLLHDRLSRALEQLYSDCQKTGSGRKPTLDEVTDLIIALSAFAPKVFVILDALDECQNREELLEAIITLKKCAVKAKLFVTSRQEPDIIEGLTEDGFAPVTILEDAIKDDIGLYVSSTLRNDTHLRRLPEELKRHIQSTLTAGAKSMQVSSIYPKKAANLCGRFRWVKCQIDTIRPLKRPKIVREVLETLPKTLDETYERILLRLSTETEDNLVQLRRTLAFVTFAKRPMTVAELAQAVVVEIRGKRLDDDAAFYDPKDLLSLCRPLIDVSPSTGLLGFVHYSVQEFLLSKRLSNAQGAVRMFALDAESCHMEIAQLCLTFVGFDDFADGPCQTFEEFQDRKEKYPFLDYAAGHWPYHTQHKDVEAAVSDLMLTLLIPQKNPKLGSMLQACEKSFTYQPGPGDDFREFRISSHQKDLIVVMRKMNSLAIASLFGFNSVLEEIVNSGADIDAPGTFMGNALQNAIYNGHIETVKTLINLGADINCPDCGGWGSALMTAIRFNRQDIVDMLLELKVDVTVGGGAYYTALHSAAYMDDVPTMKRLIQLGANIDFGKDSWKPFNINLPLGMAVSYGCSRAVLYLIASGASLCNIPVEKWANALASGGGMSKEWALRFAEELSILGHYVEVVDISKELGISEVVEGDGLELQMPSVPFCFRDKSRPRSNLQGWNLSSRLVNHVIIKSNHGNHD